MKHKIKPADNKLKQTITKINEMKQKFSSITTVLCASRGDRTFGEET